MMTGRKWSHYMWTPLVAAAGGALAALAHWPLPWMIGALISVVLVRCLTPWQIPTTPGGRKAGQWLVGVGIGLHFNAYVIERIIENIMPILGGALITMMVGAIGVWWMHTRGEQPATAFFASMPGGSAEMVNLGHRNGAALPRVAAAQTLRVVLVVLTVPALFKFFVAMPAMLPAQGQLDWGWLAAIFALSGIVAFLLQYFRKPNPWMFGAIFVSASCSSIADLHLVLPTGASEFGQIMIGSSLGGYFDKRFFKEAPIFLGRSIIATVLMATTAFAGAVIIGLLASFDFRALVLGMMPGGIAEMSLTAETLQLSVPIVTAMQTLRLVLVMLLAEPVYRWWQNKATSSN